MQYYTIQYNTIEYITNRNIIKYNIHYTIQCRDGETRPAKCYRAGLASISEKNKIYRGNETCVQMNGLVLPNANMHA